MKKRSNRKTKTQKTNQFQKQTTDRQTDTITSLCCCFARTILAPACFSFNTKTKNNQETQKKNKEKQATTKNNQEKQRKQRKKKQQQRKTKKNKKMKKWKIDRTVVQKTCLHSWSKLFLFSKLRNRETRADQKRMHHDTSVKKKTSTNFQINAFLFFLFDHTQPRQ